jgi:hypothetical protein
MRVAFLEPQQFIGENCAGRSIVTSLPRYERDREADRRRQDVKYDSVFDIVMLRWQILSMTRIARQ